MQYVVWQGISNTQKNKTTDASWWQSEMQYQSPNVISSNPIMKLTSYSTRGPSQ